MATNAGTVEVTLSANPDKVKQGTAEASASLESFGKAAAAGAKMAAVAFAGLGVGISLAVKAAVTGEDAVLKASAAFRASGEAFDVERANAFASALQNVTNAADDQTIAAQAMLATFGLTQDQTEQLLPRLADLGAAMGLDLATSARLVGSTVETGQNMLSRYGVKLDATQTKAFVAADATERLAYMLDLLDGKFSGVAATMADSFGGQLIAAKLALGDLVEEIGKLITKSEVGGLGNLKVAFDDATAAIASLTPEAKELIAQIAIGATVFTGLSAALLGVAAALPSIVGGIALLKTALAGLAVPAIAVVAALTAIVTAVGAIQNVRATLADLSSGKLTPGSTAFDPEAYKRSQKSLMGGLKDDFAMGIDTIMSPIKDAFGNLFTEIKDQASASKKIIDKTTSKAKGSAIAGGGKAEPWDMKFLGGSGAFDLVGDQLVSSHVGMADTIIAATRDATDAYVLGLDQSVEQSLMVSRVADDIWTDIEGAMLRAGSSLYDAATGTTTALGRVFNAVADTFGVGVANALADLGSKISDVAASVGSGLAKFGGGVVSQLGGKSGTGDGAGQASGIFGAAQSGADGGATGMLGAAIGYVLNETEAMQEIMTIFNDVVLEIIEAFEPVIGAIKPLALLAAETVSIVMEQLNPVFELLIPVLGALFEVVKRVQIFIVQIVQGLAGIWNGIINAIAGLFQKLGSIKLPDWLGGGHPFGFLTDWANGIRKATINTAGLDDALARLKDVTKDTAAAAGKQAEQDDAATDARTKDIGSMRDVVAARDEATQAAKKVSESLTNVPAGFKLATARFAATSADLAIAGTRVNNIGATNIASGVTIENVTIQSDNPQQVWAELKRIMQRESVVRTGSPVGTGLQYATAKV